MISQPQFRTIDKQVARTLFLEIVAIEEGAHNRVYQLSVRPPDSEKCTYHEPGYAQAHVWSKSNSKWENVCYLSGSDLSTHPIPKGGLDPAELEAACRQDRKHLLRVAYEVTTGQRWPWPDETGEEAAGSPLDEPSQLRARIADLERLVHDEYTPDDTLRAEVRDLRERVRKAASVGWCGNPISEYASKMQRILATPSPETVSVELPDALVEWAKATLDRLDRSTCFTGDGGPPDIRSEVVRELVADGRAALAATKPAEQGGGES